MSPLYSIVNALTQTAAAIILIHASPLLLSYCISLAFLCSSRLLPLARSISFLSFLFHILFLFGLTQAQLRIPAHTRVLAGACVRTHTHPHSQLTSVKAL